MEKLKNFYDKLLTHLTKENYLTDEDVKKIKQDPYYIMIPYWHKWCFQVNQLS